MTAMANIVKELDQSLAYVYCPSCRAQGTVNSHLRREMQTVRCQFGHSWDTTSFKQLLAMHPEMVPESEIVIEQPVPTAMAWKIFVTPETREAFERKFAGRVHVTIGTFLAALCADEILFVEGEAVTELRKKGMGSGAAILSALQSVTQLERERDEAIAKLTELMQMLKNSIGEK